MFRRFRKTRLGLIFFPLTLAVAKIFLSPEKPPTPTPTSLSSFSALMKKVASCCCSSSSTYVLLSEISFQIKLPQVKAGLEWTVQ